ncbi:MAG: NAD(P)-dependent oxidoreductase [Planctomycetes bacterium]|nr:NAD(P)-dependent oxidoreductase [Planctomycetota bacterium]
MTNIAVLGAGLLGSGMVENLLAKGRQVRVWNRTADKLAPLVAKGAIAAAAPADAVRGCERVHLVLAEDAAVDAVVAALRPGLGAATPVLDHSTNLPARVAERSARLHTEGVRYLHAPVFMSPQNAREASGLMLIAGPSALVEPLLAPLAEMTGKVWHCGERVDLAAVHKLSGNGVMMALAGVLGDVFAMATAAGVDRREALALFDVFKAGAALPFIGQRVLAAGDGPPSFELRMARKDVRLMLETAGAAGALTVLPAVAEAMDRALDAGNGEADFAVFARP